MEVGILLASADCVEIRIEAPHPCVIGISMDVRDHGGELALAREGADEGDGEKSVGAIATVVGGGGVGNSTIRWC